VTLLLTVGLAVLIGISLGLLGGGSIHAVPLLVYVAGLPAKEAIATSLLVVGVTSAVGVLVGAGGGFLVVPALALLGGLPMPVFVLAQQLLPHMGIGPAAVGALAAAGTVTVASARRRRREHSGQQHLGRPVRELTGTGVER
jgi:uncharacterized membrane protein YfcA